MIFPPFLLRLLVQTPQRRLSLWLPQVLVWPVFALVALLVAPVIIIGAAVTWSRGWGKPVLLAGPRLLGLFCALRGLDVTVDKPPKRVVISFR